MVITYGYNLETYMVLVVLGYLFALGIRWVVISIMDNQPRD